MLHFAHDANEVNGSGDWYRNFEYQVERERGLDFNEDLFSPFLLKFDMTDRSSASIIASTEILEARDVEEYRQAEIMRRAEIIAAPPIEDQLVSALLAAADQYIVAREHCKTVIAGYHWFGDWGRDTMIALPGLALVTGRTGMAKSILLEFAKHIDRGMLPNRFPDAGETPEYNTVDATLWYFEALRALGEYTNDYDFIKTNFYAGLVDIIDWHERGTRYGIKVDHDGLLLSGEPGVQLTWMDAKVGDYVVTPRQGKAVEIQALWYNALRVTEELAARFGDRANKKRFGDMASRAKRSFENQFWNEQAGCLYDVVSGDGRDASIRPNQILAVSLKHSMLSREKSKNVIEVVEGELLTPYGLRSLAHSDPAYRPRYEGGVWDRDTAYHQGTVWPWLMGPFITAYVRTNGSTKRARERAKELLGPLQDHLSDAGLGHISEILDAESPHAPRGCIAQAWSVAEILRAAVEDVFAVKPTPKRQNAVRSVAKWLNSRRGGHSRLYPVCQDPWIRNSPFPLSRETTAKSSAQGNKRTRSRDIMLRCLGDSFFDLIGDLIMDQNFPLRSVVVPAYAPEVQGNPGFPALIPNRQIGDGRYVARFAHTKEELFAALKLRFEVFNLELGEGIQASFLTGRDIDEFDEQCHHLIVVDTENQDRVVGTYRMQTSEMARAGRGFYSNVEFELSTLPPEVLSDSIELGRACVAQDHRNTAVLFLLWRGLAAY